METNFPSRMFYGICFPWIQNEATACACLSKLQPLRAGWRHILSQVVLVAKPRRKKLPGWGLFTPLRWAGDTISLDFFEERAVLQPSSMNWSFRKPRPEFERIWANRWVLVKTKSDFDPKPAKLSDFEHLSRIQWSQEVRDGEDTETQCWCISLI